ncbi:MAG: pyridoxamine 5'-phosphate oxidase family protein, partial [Bacteroidota bacterium]
ARTLVIYTDSRTQKVKDIQQISQVSLVFWDKGKSTQIRASGKATLHHEDTLAKQYWDKIPAKNRRDYATRQAPGSERDETSYLPDYWQAEELDKEKTEAHFKHFVVLSLVVSQIDYLRLSRDGHSRAKLVWEAEEWQGNLVVP